MLEIVQICSSRGRRSRNKVSVGEPAEGSLTSTTLKTLQPCKLLSYLNLRLCIKVFLQTFVQLSKTQTTNARSKDLKFEKSNQIPFSDGSLGSRNDEERRETRYVMWIAGLSESSNLWTQMAALALAVGAYLVQTRLPNAKCSIERDTGRCYS